MALPVHSVFHNMNPLKLEPAARLHNWRPIYFGKEI